MSPFQSDFERDYYSWVGLYISTWAGVETNLALIVQMIFEHLDGKLIEKDCPQSLSRRLKFLRKASGKLDALSNEKDEIYALTDTLSSESNFRHDIVHGIKTSIGFSDHKSIMVARPVAINDPLGEIVRTNVSLAILEEKYQILGLSGLSLMGLGRRIINLIDKERE
ncbi:hypothetical protein [Roseibium suaedae]|uniref:Apea-like HEPN domain-containing protein n=1 Tax=Roseibium suaedae TaxID=735517 RepID=A0A1M7P6T2_9HYPH|nr:hypothetical protein [Roseibium suaedae]SHN11869.1 hypothetical protein SAMN05444272_4125 [Roseibium suaedae]